MVRTILCAVCGTEFEAQRSTRKFCSDSCRERSRKAGASITPIREKSGGLVASVQRTLRDAERLETPDGEIAVLLAERLMAGAADTGSSVAAVARELRAALDKALAGVARGSDPVDELAQRRRLRHGAG
jgi:hypothetical protein